MGELANQLLVGYSPTFLYDPFFRFAFELSLCPQALHWITDNRFDRLEAYRQHRDTYDRYARYSENPPFDIYPICVVLQPFIH